MCIRDRLITCVLICLLWSSVYFDETLLGKSCLVIEKDDGTHQRMDTHDTSLSKAGKNITNVGSRFEYLAVSYLAQGILSLFTVSYQVLAIFCMSSLLVYRHYISRINKLVLLYGAYILVMTHIYRFDEAGKICSGDYLTNE